jgi:non-heme chloroperoxidase
MKKTSLIFFFLIFSNLILAQKPEFKIPDGCKENYFTTSDNVRLRYLVAGQGEAIVFIPGWTMSAEIWELQIEHFSKTNTVIVIDPRSQGKSDQVTDGLYFEREARDVKELVDHVKLPSYTLVGWSWAGPMLFYYAKLFSTPAVKGIVMVDPPVRTNEAFLTWLSGMMKSVLTNRENHATEFTKGLFTAPVSDSYLQKVRASSLKTSTAAAVTLLAVFFCYHDAEWVQILKETSIPVLFIAADGSKPEYEDLDKEVKVRYVIVPGSGHTVFVDKPAEFNKALADFILRK